jgi:nucleoside-diphosphate-sugar epimerase
MSEPSRILVTGAGGFIGHHLVTYLKKQGYWVRGVDVKYPEYTRTDADEFAQVDLRHWDQAQRVTHDIDDCVVGLVKLMRSVYREPLNLGQDRLVTINHLD